MFLLLTRILLATIYLLDFPFIGLDWWAGAVRSIDWSFDGKSLLSGGYDNQVHITDAETGQCAQVSSSVPPPPPTPPVFLD